MNRNESIRGMRINDKRSLTGWTEFAERAGRSTIDTLPSPLGNRAAATTKMPQRDIHGFHLSDLWQVRDPSRIGFSTHLESVSANHLEDYSVGDGQEVDSG